MRRIYCVVGDSLNPVVDVASSWRTCTHSMERCRRTVSGDVAADPDALSIPRP